MNFSFSRAPRALIFASVLGLAITSQVSQAQPAPRGAGAAQGQMVTPEALAGTIQNSVRAQNSDALLQAYGQAVTTPELARVAISQLLNDYYRLRNQAQTAEQATQAVSEAMLRFMVLQTAQNQILVQQNQQMLQQNERIIELLEAQAPPKPAAPPRARR